MKDAELAASLRWTRDELPSSHPGHGIPIPDNFSWRQLELIHIALGLKMDWVKFLDENAPEIDEALKKQRRSAKWRSGGENRWGEMMRARQLLLQSSRKRKAIALAAARARWRKAKGLRHK